jgi:uncharacterized protein YnzC (UPF0291/DUF896 family)
MSIKQTCQKCNSTIQTGGCPILCSSCIEKEFKNENIAILDELNDWLAEKNKERKYQFVYTQSPNGFSFALNEFKTLGHSYVVFDSNEPLSGMIEEAYEANDLTFRQIVLEMIKRNIQTHIKTLEIAAQIMRDI